MFCPFYTHEEHTKYWSFVKSVEYLPHLPSINHHLYLSPILREIRLLQDNMQHARTKLTAQGPRSKNLPSKSRARSRCTWLSSTCRGEGQQLLPATKNKNPCDCRANASGAPDRYVTCNKLNKKAGRQTLTAENCHPTEQCHWGGPSLLIPLSVTPFLQTPAEVFLGMQLSPVPTALLHFFSAHFSRAPWCCCRTALRGGSSPSGFQIFSP